MVTFHIITIFPEFFSSPLDVGLIKKAREKNIVDFEIIDLKKFGVGKHKLIDDRPYGGGSGMILRPEPVCSAIQSAKIKNPDRKRVILMTPSGELLTQQKLKELSSLSDIVIVCPRYEGVDERVKKYVDEEISIGDYVIHSGDTASLVLIEGVVRLKEGFMSSSPEEEIYFSLLDFPQYTRPRFFENSEVPPVLLSGDHKKIRFWRIEQSVRKTIEKRPDLILKLILQNDELKDFLKDELEKIISYLLTLSYRKGKEIQRRSDFDEKIFSAVFHFFSDMPLENDPFSPF